MPDFDPVANGLTPYSPGSAGVQPGSTPPSFSGPSAEQQSSMQAQGPANLQRFNAIADAGTQARMQDTVLSNMQNDLQNFTPGPGADWSEYGKKLIQRYTPGFIQSFATGDPNGFFAKSIAAQESFDKLANQLVTTAAPGSDARQAVIQGATPNSGQSPAGVDFILRQLRGVADYNIARANLAAPLNAAGANYAAFQAGPGGQLDPQVFQFARLTPAQQQTFLNGIPAGEQAAFKKEFVDAWKHGFYGVNNGMPPIGQ
jgi:hypothetical protein